MSSLGSEYHDVPIPPSQPNLPTGPDTSVRFVTIATPKVGALVNRVNTSDKIAPWTFGAGALMQSLARRGVL